MDRAFRIGQQRTVEVYRMIGLGTLEELKYERQSEFVLRLYNCKHNLTISSSQATTIPAVE